LRQLIYEKRPKGYQKIYEICLRALEHNYNYAWIDTCCINKDSSAELTESINSMFQWYKNASACYVFLSDLDSTSDNALTNCKWFTRGWTLQELIAPKEVFFYDKMWGYVGTRDDYSDAISSGTSISQDVLLGRKPLWECSVATRMSWAAHRETTRTEDLAYCLLGIFEVSMPMIYGEGTNAFRRLQEEIVRRSNDLTIFVWDQNLEEAAHPGIFALSPAAFAASKDVEQISKRWMDPEFAVTNKGLRIDNFKNIWKKPIRDEEGKTVTTYSIPLAFREKDNIKYIAMRLRKIGPDLFIRNGKLLPSAWNQGIQTAGSIYLYSVRSDEFVDWRRSDASWFSGQDFQIQDVVPESHWDEADSSFFAPLDDIRLVMAAKGIIALGKEQIVPVQVVVSIDYRRSDLKCRIFDAQKHAEITKWLFWQKRSRHNLTWEDIKVDKPQMLDFTNKIEVAASGERHEISVSVIDREEGLYEIDIKVQTLPLLEQGRAPRSSERKSVFKTILPDRQRHSPRLR
jgi:Heterokaryon incompatibility protein (HET)